MGGTNPQCNGASGWLCTQASAGGQSRVSKGSTPLVIAGGGGGGGYVGNGGDGGGIVGQDGLRCRTDPSCDDSPYEQSGFAFQACDNRRHGTGGTQSSGGEGCICYSSGVARGNPPGHTAVPNCASTYECGSEGFEGYGGYSSCDGGCAEGGGGGGGLWGGGAGGNNGGGGGGSGYFAPQVVDGIFLMGLDVTDGIDNYVAGTAVPVAGSGGADAPTPCGAKGGNGLVVITYLAPSPPFPPFPPPSPPFLPGALCTLCAALCLPSTRSIPSAASVRHPSLDALAYCLGPTPRW